MSPLVLLLLAEQACGLSFSEGILLCPNEAGETRSASSEEAKAKKKGGNAPVYIRQNRDHRAAQCLRMASVKAKRRRKCSIVSS